MDMTNLGTILAALIAGVSSSAAWQFYTKKLIAANKKDLDEREQFNMYQDDLRERVAVLESKLEESYKEREAMQNKMLILVETTAAMRVEIDYLRKENETLRKQLKAASN